MNMAKASNPDALTGIANARSLGIPVPDNTMTAECIDLLLSRLADVPYPTEADFAPRSGDAPASGILRVALP